MVVLALVAAGGAFALSQRGGSSPAPAQPSLFPARFSEPGFLSGEVRLVSSYDAVAGSRRVTGTVDVRGTAYVVARCTAGSVRIDVAGLSSARPCTGAPVGVVALNVTSRTRLTASVSTSQRSTWGVAIYQ